MAKTLYCEKCKTVAVREDLIDVLQAFVRAGVLEEEGGSYYHKECGGRLLTDSAN